MVALTVGAIIAAEWVFVHFTHALQSQSLGVNTSATATAEMSTANHLYLVIAVVFGAIVGLISASAVIDPAAEGQLKTMLLLPVPMIGTLALGISLGGYRVVSLVDIAVVLSIGTSLRRFGPRSMVVGLILYMGDFLGFLVHKALTVSDLGWLSAEIGVGLVVAMVVRFALFYPRPARSLARTQRSFGARADKVATADDPRRLRTQTLQASRRPGGRYPRRRHRRSDSGHSTREVSGRVSAGDRLSSPEAAQSRTGGRNPHRTTRLARTTGTY
jgi:hypothetical protein